MKIRMEMDEEVVMTIVQLLKHTDPTGFMFSKLIQQILNVVEQTHKKANVPLEPDGENFKLQEKGK